MSRKDLLRFVQMADPAANQMQANLRDALTVLSADNDILGAPVLTFTASGTIPQGTSVVAFNGRTGQSVNLPAANALGASVGALVLFLNVSTNAVTVFPSGSDKINGLASLSIAAGAVVALVSDGVSRWLALAPGAGGSGITQLTGPVTAGPGSGSQATSVTANALTNAMLAQMATLTVKGNNTGGTANAVDLTVAQMQAMITYPGRLRSFQVLTSGTTYTRPAGITSILVEGWAGGGGGGGTAAAAAVQAAVAAGGGSGGYFRKWYLVAPATGTYAIGAAGTAGANTGAVAGNGGNTTFTDGTTLCTANGGAGCPAQALTTAATGGFAKGGAGGAISTNGDINLGGSDGGVALRAANAGTANDAVSGCGGGIGGGTPNGSSGAGNAARNIGAGGAGALALASGAAATGGAGGAGQIIVWEFA